MNHATSTLSGLTLAGPWPGGEEVLVLHTLGFALLHQDLGWRQSRISSSHLETFA